MRTLGSILIIVASMTWAVFSGAECRDGYELFYRNGVGDEFCYEPESVVVRDERSSIIIVRVNGTSANPDTPMREFNRVMEINCRQRTYRNIESEIVGNDGKRLISRQASAWTPATAEDSPYRLLAVAVCKRAKIRH